MIAEDDEDMWHAYNLIRKVQTESSTGSSSSNRIRTILTIKVETIDYDTQACVLRLKGRNVQENQFVKVDNKKSTVNMKNFCKFLSFYTDGSLSYLRFGSKSKIYNKKTF